MTHKIDFHTHSTASKDGGIRPEQYRQLIGEQSFGAIAVTDHNRIDMALSLHRELGDAIIVGEEVTTLEGDIIGLYLTKAVPPNLPLDSAVKAIKAQGGLLYIPHPFESVRHGLNSYVLGGIADQVDIVEVYNGRAVFQNRGPQAVAWAKLHNKATAASSDAHNLKGMGTAFTLLDDLPRRDDCLALLGRGRLITSRPPLISLLAPKYNRLRKRAGVR